MEQTNKTTIVAANDNEPRHAETFATLSDRRAWIASLKMPKNDSDIAPVLACPTMARLGKAGDERAGILAQWTAMMAPLHMSGSMHIANDNEPTEEGWERAAWHQDDTSDKLAADRLREVRPTINEIIAASSVPVLRVAVKTTRSMEGHWTAPVVFEFRNADFDGDFATLGGLHFYRGELKHYESCGKKWKPRDDLRGGKGGSRPARTDADIRRYLSRPGSPFPDQWRTHDGARAYEMSERTAASYSMLVEHGVDGSVAIENLPIKITKEPTGIARIGHWIGGVVASTSSGGGNMDASAVESEIARTASARSVRSRIGEGDAHLLDLASTRLTSEEIGIEFGFAGKYAERWAVAAIDKAIGRIAA